MRSGTGCVRQPQPDKKRQVVCCAGVLARLPKSMMPMNTTSPLCMVQPVVLSPSNTQPGNHFTDSTHIKECLLQVCWLCVAELHVAIQPRQATRLLVPADRDDSSVLRSGRSNRMPHRLKQSLVMGARDTSDKPPLLLCSSCCNVPSPACSRQLQGTHNLSQLSASPAQN